MSLNMSVARGALVIALAFSAAELLADHELVFDPAARPFMDMRREGCLKDLGFDSKRGCFCESAGSSAVHTFRDTLQAASLLLAGSTNRLDFSIGDPPEKEAGHFGVMCRIFGEAARLNPLLYLRGTSQGGVEYALAGDGRGGYCLLMVNAKKTAERFIVRIPGRQFAAPTYRAMSCPERFVDCREVPGGGRYWLELSWEDTQTGYETWSNWEPQGNTYVPLPSGVNPKCDDMAVSIEPYAVQSVEFMTRKSQAGK